MKWVILALTFLNKRYEIRLTRFTAAHHNDLYFLLVICASLNCHFYFLLVISLHFSTTVSCRRVTRLLFFHNSALPLTHWRETGNEVALFRDTAPHSNQASLSGRFLRHKIEKSTSGLTYSYSGNCGWGSFCSLIFLNREKCYGGGWWYSINTYILAPGADERFCLLIYLTREGME